MAAHACLKNEFTEDKKYHNLMRWLDKFCYQVKDKLIIILPLLPGSYQKSVYQKGVYPSHDGVSIEEQRLSAPARRGCRLSAWPLGGY